MPVPLLRRSLLRPRAQAQPAVIAGLSGATMGGEQGALVVSVLAHHGGMRVEGPVYVGATHGRLLVTDDLAATPALLAHLLADVTPSATPTHAGATH